MSKQTTNKTKKRALLPAERRALRQIITAVLLAAGFLTFYFGWRYVRTKTLSTIESVVVPAKQAATAPAGASAMVEGMPRPQGSSPLFAAMRACMQQLGLRCDYDYVVGASGAGFRRAFKVDAPGDDPRLFGHEPLRRLCWVLAIDDTLMTGEPAVLTAAVRQAIDGGQPVIGFGIGGLPQASVIAGYAQDGQTLKGYAPQHPEQQPMQQWENWTGSMQATPGAGLLFPGVHKGRFPPEREILATALKYAVNLQRTGKREELPGYVCGLEATRAWAAMLEDRKLFPTNEPEVIKLRAQVHASQVAMLRDRAGAAYFLRQAAASTPEAADHLSLAANLFDEAAGHAVNLMREDLVSALSSNDTRSLFASEVLAAYKAELKAVVELEKAMAVPPQLPQRAQIRTPTPSEMTRGAKWQIEASPIPIAFRAAMDVLGEDFGRTTRDGFATNDAYTLFAGVCGDAFETGINIAVDGNRLDISRRVTPIEREVAYHRSLEAAGYAGEVLLRPENGQPGGSFTYEAIRQKIVRAISNDACPVILHGVSGPERYTVVTAYEQSAAALYGWSAGGKASSIIFEPEKLEKHRDWFDHADSVVIIGKRLGQRDERAMYLRALQRGVELLQRREVGGYHAGPAVYEIWSKPFDRNYPIGTGGTKELQGLLTTTLWELAERRHTTERFVQMAAHALPEAKTELLAAAAEFRAIHDLMWKINELAGEGYEKVAEPAIRLEIARLIREAQRHDATAAEQMQQAIARAPAGAGKQMP